MSKTMSDHGDFTDNRQSSSTPTSTTSGNLSSEFLPSSLTAEELQLALNKVSRNYKWLLTLSDIVITKHLLELDKNNS